jgi:hypothetical protein
VPPIITRARTRLGWWIAGGALCLLAAAALLFRFNPSQYGFYPRCALYVTTGLYCPGCGSTRAVYYLLHGEVATALRCNLLLVCGLPVLGFVFARYAYCLWARKPLPRVSFRSWHIKLLIGALVLFTILRNIPVAPFTCLSPP